MKKPQLFLLHFAGGTHYSFQGMTPFLTDFEVVPLELPGRGERLHEDLIQEFDVAAEDFFRQISKKLRSGDFVVYGHSMGAFLALRVVGMLIRQNRYPLCMIVSGNAGPGLDRGAKRYLFEHDAFIGELKKLGGISREILDNKDLLDLFLPILRSDFKVAEENGMDAEPAVDVPIFAVMGDEEDYAKEITNWRRFTSAGFEYKLLPGGHFFIFEHFREIANIIRSSFYHSASLRR